MNLIIDDEMKEFGRQMAMILRDSDDRELKAVGDWMLAAVVDLTNLTAGPVDDGMYFIQDTRSYVGNCVVWWGKDSRGYTTNISEAGRYTHKQAFSQMESRDTDIPWKCIDIEPLARQTIDAQYLPRQYEQQRQVVRNKL